MQESLLFLGSTLRATDPPDTASWEEFEDTQKRLEEIRRQLGEIDTYMRDVIDPVRDRLRDPENLMTPDELREFNRKAEEAMPAALRAEVSNLRKEENAVKASGPSPSTAADQYVGPARLNAPDLFAQFESASPMTVGDAFAPQEPGPGDAPPHEPAQAPASSAPKTP